MGGREPGIDERRLEEQGQEEQEKAAQAAQAAQAKLKAQEKHMKQKQEAEAEAVVVVAEESAGSCVHLQHRQGCERVQGCL